jgi:hypothetical protein
MFDDFKELLSIFNAQKVKYLIVGGYAVSFHSQPRATNDIDLLIKPDADNAKAVHAALGKFGAPLDGLTAEDFIERDKFFRMGRAPVIVDILPEIKGIDFDRAWQNRVEAVIDPQRGITAFFISRQDLITAKLASGRPQDIADMAAQGGKITVMPVKIKRARRRAVGQFDSESESSREIPRPAGENAGLGMTAAERVRIVETKLTHAQSATGSPIN